METKYKCTTNDVPDNILIVDDDLVNRMTLKKLFSPYYTIVEAGDGHEGLEKILDDKYRFCAILLDILMPGLDGIEVLRRLNELGLQDKIPVFIITSDTDRDVMRAAYELGAMDVIRKPVIPYMVVRRVQSVVELFAARVHLNNVVEKQSISLLKQAEKIIRLKQGMIEALATIIEFRNEESGGHVQRISMITKLLFENTAFGQNLKKEDIENIALAAVLHDVGKIAIPDAVLTKPGKLTTDEYTIMKDHTIRGVEIMENIPQMHDSEIYEYARDIARHHHERWDGNGYPDGLKGDEISPWAQVVSLADVYDALICRRVYKPPFPREKVLEMIETGRCGVFNPKLLESFLSVEDAIYKIYQNLPEVKEDSGR